MLSRRVELGICEVVVESRLLLCHSYSFDPSRCPSTSHDHRHLLSHLFVLPLLLLPLPQQSVSMLISAAADSWLPSCEPVRSLGKTDSPYSGGASIDTMYQKQQEHGEDIPNFPEVDLLEWGKLR